MKFPSLQTLARSIVLTGKRFPLPMLFIITACIFSSRINHLQSASADTGYYLYNIVLCCYLGMLLTLVTAVYAERNKIAMGARGLINVLAVGLIVAYYYSLPGHLATISVQRSMLLLVALHLLIAFTPFIGRVEMNGFWQYNKILFLRILMVGLYSGVLYLGLALAMLAVEKLFKVNIDYKWYLDLWVWIAGLFNTAFFLAGFPEGYGQLEEERDYPKGLKIFTQYILLPIITIYLLIMYAYMFKIIATREWPFGWVSYLVLIFAIAGILSLLLIHPIRNEENNKWILGFGRLFYFAICPLIVLLFLAIERRIREYGITGERYFVLALALWLAFIALYFLLSKNKNIKLIPVSLCLLAFLSSFGPWGAFSVSRHSQTSRLREFLVKNNMLFAGKFVPMKGKIPAHDNGEITSIVRYLVNTHGYSSLQSLFSANLDSMMKVDNNIDLYSFGTYGQSEKLLTYMGVDDRNGSDSMENTFISFETDDEKGSISPITGYDHLINGYVENSFRDKDEWVRNYSSGNESLRITFEPDNGTISVRNAVDTPMLFNVRALALSLNGKAYNRFSRISQDSMTLSGENAGLSVKFLFNQIAGQRENSGIKVNTIRANILLKFKRVAYADPKAK
jgi:hypothetical protein